MSYLTTLNQVATLWTRTGLDRYGKGTYERTDDLACRWEDRSELILNKHGQEIVSRSRVFFGQDIPLEAYLYLGSSAASDPTTVKGAFEVQQRKMTPDLRNLQQLHVAFL